LFKQLLCNFNVVGDSNLEQAPHVPGKHIHIQAFEAPSSIDNFFQRADKNCDQSVLAKTIFL